MIDEFKMLQFAKDIAYEASKIILSFQNTSNKNVSTKQDQSP